MVATKTSALEQEVRDRQAGAGLPSERGQDQLPLLPVGLLGEDAAGEPVKETKIGRPVGSRNRKTKEWVEYCLKRYQSPLVGLLETAARPVEELARELGCSNLEAFDRQMEAMKNVAPYLHQKLPTAVEFTGSEGIPLMLSVSPAMAANVQEPGAVIDEEGRLQLEASVEDPLDALSEKGEIENADR